VSAKLTSSFAGVAAPGPGHHRNGPVRPAHLL